MKKLIVVLIMVMSSCMSLQKNQILKTNSNLKLEFSRGACYGTCPIYTISVFEDRLVKYNGKRFVEQQGVFEWYMERADFKELNKLLARTELSKSIEYNMRAIDLPLTSMTIYQATDTLRLKHKGGVPESLKQSLKEVELLLIKSANWAK